MSVGPNAFALLDDHVMINHSDAPRKKRKGKSNRGRQSKDYGINGIGHVGDDGQSAEKEDTTDSSTITAISSKVPPPCANTTSGPGNGLCLQPISVVHTNGVPHRGTSCFVQLLSIVEREHVGEVQGA